MLSSLSLLNDSQHSSMASTASSLPTTATEASLIAAPRISSSQVQLESAATTSTSFGSSRPHHDQRDLVHEGKENISPPHPNRSTETGHSHHSEDGSLVVFPEKQLVNAKSNLPADAPSPSTQELLRQQELQLRVLQEQVCTNIYIFLLLTFFSSI